MVKHKAEDCIQTIPIYGLKKDNETMAKNINDIKGDVSDIKSDITLIKEFILTSPQKFANKEKTEKFMNGVNLKLAFVSGIIWVGLFVADKYF